MSLSEEQRLVVASVCADPRHNVIQGVPGAGKSKVIMDIAARRVQETNGCGLLLTFSSALKIEGRARSRDAGLDGKLHVHSYHSAVHGLFEGVGVCPTDVELKLFLAHVNQSSSTAKKHSSINTLFLDEAQDMTPLYLELVVYILRQYSITKIVVLGDWFQSLFRYNGSFTGCLERPDVHLGGTWAPLLQLSTSFRLPPGLCEWINLNLDPRKMREHYPRTWQLIGDTITRFWGEGIQPHAGHRRARDSTSDVVREVVYTESDVLNGNSAAVNSALARVGYQRGQELVVLSSLGKIGLGMTPSIVNDHSEIAWGVKEGNATGGFDPSGAKAGLVCSPQYFKGMEASVVVTYCSSALEPRTDAECADELSCLDAYCALYVACTRSKDGLVVLRSASTPRFFTERTECSRHGYTSGTAMQRPSSTIRRQGLRSTSLSSYLKFADATSCDALLDGGASSLRTAVDSFMAPIDIARWTHVNGTFSGTTEEVYPLLTRAVELALWFYRRTGRTFGCTDDWKDAVWKVIDEVQSSSGYKHLTRQIPHSFDWLDGTFMAQLLGRVIFLLESLPENRAYALQTAKLRISQTIACFPPTLWHEGTRTVVLFDWATHIPANKSVVDNRRPICSLAAYNAHHCYVIYPVIGCIRLVEVAPSKQ